MSTLKQIWSAEPGLGRTAAALAVVAVAARVVAVVGGSAAEIWAGVLLAHAFAAFTFFWLFAMVVHRLQLGTDAFFAPARGTETLEPHADARRQSLVPLRVLLLVLALANLTWELVRLAQSGAEPAALRSFAAIWLLLAATCLLVAHHLEVAIARAKQRVGSAAT